MKIKNPTSVFKVKKFHFQYVFDTCKRNIITCSLLVLETKNDHSIKKM